MPERRRVTLKDVAAQAGVSYQTVSKVLRGQIRVTPEVKARIEQAVQELDYRPNVTAQNLRTRSTHLIGYLWQPDPPDELNPVLEQFLHSVVETAEAEGYNILLCPEPEDEEDILSAYQQLARTSRVDGFILSDLAYEDPRIDLLRLLKIPFVAFGRSAEHVTYPFVDIDGRAGLRRMTNHLIEQGHRRIAVLGWPESSRVGTDRLNGYWEAMELANLPIDEAWIIQQDGVDFGYEAASELLELSVDRRPTAIVTLFDLLAFGAMRAVQDYGLVVGRDVAITGFGNMPINHYITPGITSLKQPVREVGHALTTMLIALLNGQELDNPQILIEPELVIRESSQSHWVR
ncbi:MAG: LacI family transcriptional regulator [Chloroflexi bacterium]|nr:LacI family transcriptional regulator [Chloroflexota bacterium]